MKDWKGEASETMPAYDRIGWDLMLRTWRRHS
jgi:hypothetical protein